MASAARAHEYSASSQQEQRFASQQHEEAVREMEQIRHTNATLDVAGSDSFRAQTEQAAIRIVTPHYKIPEKPGKDVHLGSSVADLSSKFAEANGADYKAERSQEHFRMQIIDPKVVSHALVPGHAIRDYARRHLIDDFPSLHGKRSFLDLDALEQLRLRRQGHLGDAIDRDKDLEKYLKNRDGKRWDMPPPPKVEDESLREFDRLRQNIDHLQKASFRRSKSMGELRPVKRRLPKATTAADIDGHQQKQQQKSDAGKPVALDQQMNGNGGRRQQADHRSRIAWNMEQEQTAATGGASFLLMMVKPGGVSNRTAAEPSTAEARFSSLSSSQLSSSSFSSLHQGPSTSAARTHWWPQQQQQHKQPTRLRHSFPAINGTQRQQIIRTAPHQQQQQKSKEDKAVQAEVEEASAANWRRHLLLIANESGADIQEWRRTGSQQQTQPMMMESNGVQQQQLPKSILKQPQQQQSSSYSLQQAGSSEPDGHSWEDRGEIGLSVETDEQRALVEQMQRNLAMHRQPSPRSSGSGYPAVPFDGPFFRLHEISPDGRGRPVGFEQPGPGPSSTTMTSSSGAPPPPPPPPPGWTPRQAATTAAAMMMPGRMEENGQQQRRAAPEGGGMGQQQREQQQHQAVDEDGRVVYWPPLSNGRGTAKPEVPPPKNLRDPERLAEFMRQEQVQQEAEAVKAQREQDLWDRQVRAVQLQQELLVRRQHQQPPPPNGAANFSPFGGAQSDPGRPSTSQSQQQQFLQQSPGQQAYGQPSPRVRVFEARPVSAAGTADGYPPPPEFVSGGSSASPCTWRRTYILDANRTERIDERNEILTSEERLIRERFDIDMLKRRESFIEKPDRPPEIQRLGRRWQPPPEKPYRWPRATPGPGALPSSQLDQQQFPYPLSVQTTSDGGGGSGEEHRWTPVVRDPGFRAERKQFTPEPSPPDSPIRGHGTGPLEDVARRQTAGMVLPSPDGSHRPKAEFSRVRRPPSGGFVPHAPNAVRVTTRRRESRLEEEQVQQQYPENGDGRPTAISRSSRQSVPPGGEEDEEEDYENLLLLSNGNGVHNHHQLPRHSSTIVQLGPLPRVEVRRRIKLLETRAATGERSRSAVPRRANGGGARSPSAQRSLERMRRLTAASPAPASYARAHKYVPPALPPGHREPINGHQGRQQQERPQVPARHARRMAEAVQNAAQAHQQSREPLGAKLAPADFTTRKGAGNGQPRAAEQQPSSGRRVVEVTHGGRPSAAENGRRQQPAADSRWQQQQNGGGTPMIGPDGEVVKSYRAERTVEHRRYTKKE